jgi:hypothetical protein
LLLESKRGENEHGSVAIRIPASPRGSSTAAPTTWFAARSAMAEIREVLKSILKGVFTE